MEVKKAIKKVVALAAGATMLGATMFSAMAASSLTAYPSPFVKDGKFDAFIVVGDKAAAEDVVGAVDIGASLQFEMKKDSMVSTGSENVLISDGVKIKGTGSEVLNYNESLGEVRATPIDSEDLPVLLADGRYVESEGATDNDQSYTQEIRLNDTNGRSLHDQPTDMVHDDYLELIGGDVVYKYTLQFDDPVEYDTDGSINGALADDIEGTQIELQGNVYTITKARFTSGGNLSDMTLMAGDTLLWLMQDQVIEKTVNGVKHEVKVVDVTDAQDSCGVSVDGYVAWIDTKSDKVINGIDIGVLDAKAVHAQLQDVDICELNIGATEIKIEDAMTGSVAAMPGSSRITVDGMEIKKARVGLVNAGAGNWDALTIEFTPQDDVFLKKDETFADPVLGNFKLLMGGVVTPREVIDVKASGSKKATIDFTNNDGKAVSVPIEVNDTETGWRLGTRDKEPVLMEGDSYYCGVSIEDCDGVLLYAISSGRAAHVLEITSISTDDTSIDLRDLTYGRTFDNKNYSQLIDLGSLGYIKLADGGSGVLTATELSNVTDNVAETNYGARIELDPLNAFDGTVFMPAGTTNVLGTDAALLVRVNESDIDDVDIRAQLINVTGMYDNVSDDQFEIRLQTSGLIIEPKGGVDESEDNSDIQYYTTLHGTLVKADDQDNKYVIINYPKQEVEINAFIAPVAAQISTSGGNIATVTLDKINVGAARLASEISDVTKDNLILVGGACANAATATVEGVSQSEPDCIAGLQSGEAVIKLYDQSSGKVAMVVAGMDAMDTRRATRVISNFDAYNLSGSEVKVTGTSLTDIKVSMPS